MIYTSLLLYMSEDGDRGLGLSLSSAATMIKIDMGNDGARRERGERMQTYISTLMDAARKLELGLPESVGIDEIGKDGRLSGPAWCGETLVVAGPPA